MNLAPRQLRPATRADLDALPPTWRGEIIEGELYAFPRPGAPHAVVETSISADLSAPFQRGRGGPGGWWILVEPGIQLPRAPEIAPDLAGWLRERLPALPRTGPIEVAPDWICEILSPSTRSYDMLVKRPFYAQLGVPYLWYVDPESRTLTASRLEDGRCSVMRLATRILRSFSGEPHDGPGAPLARPPERSGARGPRERRRWGVRRGEAPRFRVELGVYGGDQIARIEPFEAIEISLAAWWEMGPS